jgi:hypothetical protein
MGKVKVTQNNQHFSLYFCEILGFDGGEYENLFRYRLLRRVVW